LDFDFIVFFTVFFNSSFIQLTLSIFLKKSPIVMLFISQNSSATSFAMLDFHAPGFQVSIMVGILFLSISYFLKNLLIIPLPFLSMSPLEHILTSDR